MTPLSFLAAAIAALAGAALGLSEGLQAALGLVAIACVLALQEALR